MYLTRIPRLIRRFYSQYIWRYPTDVKELYLTFDDGPTPEITLWVLDQLKVYDAKATFFLIGEKVEKYPEIVHEIIDRGHAIGNHTQNHLNGRKTETRKYLRNVLQGQQAISEYSGYHTQLFRPPYGKITSTQARYVMERNQIVMMDVISGDFDQNLSKEACLQNVIRASREGSIVLFHDSEKAWPRLEYALPRTLEHFYNLGFKSKAISVSEPAVI